MRSSSRQRRIENGNVVVNQEEQMKTQKNSLYMPYDMEEERAIGCVADVDV